MLLYYKRFIPELRRHYVGLTSTINLNSKRKTGKTLYKTKQYRKPDLL